MRKRWFVVVVTGVLLLACNLPTSAQPPSSPATAQAIAAMTVQAALTQAANGGQTAIVTPSSLTPSPEATPSSSPLPPTATPAPTATPLPTATVTAQPCNLATFIKDVTVPDDTVFQPGEHFTKTWRLKNVGTCAWQNYALVFDSGDPMGAPPSVPIPGVVAPGQAVDVSVDFIAPDGAGTYKGYWRLRDDKGVIFGLTTGNPFWVQIKVVPPSPTPVPTLPPPAMIVMDFYQRAPDAQWRNSDHLTLSFPGAGNDSRGFARYADGYVLEDGHVHSRVLETHPKWSAYGRISGYYPAVTLPPNSHFRAKIGFIAASGGGCGAGDATFRFFIRVAGTTHRLGEWHKVCNGHLQSVEVDLSAYAGQSATMFIQVDAGATSSQDWAVWVNPLVATP